MSVTSYYFVERNKHAVRQFFHFFLFLDCWECPESDEDTVHFYPHDKNCWQFYECAGGRKWLFSCRYGTYWDQQLTTCDLNMAACGSLSTDRPSTTTQLPTDTTPSFLF